jgi:SAM-dependent methyltransferase
MLMIGDSLEVSRSIKDIDWARIWHQQMDEATFRGQGADFWDNWARALPVKTEHSGYVDEVLSRLNLSPEYSVLDVGAGTGALAIPLAKKVRQVTALDQSAVMLEMIQNSCHAAGLNNVLTLKMDWTKARIGVDFPKHDVVVVSRSLPSGKDISNSLKLIDKAAERFCYITWKADGHDDMESELSQLMGIPYVTFPGHIVIYNLLHSLGIYANIELFKTCGRRRYVTLEEAYLQIIRSYPLEDAKKPAIMDFLASRLKFENGAYTRPKNAVWALIWWNKADS